MQVFMVMMPPRGMNTTSPAVSSWISPLIVTVEGALDPVEDLVCFLMVVGSRHLGTGRNDELDGGCAGFGTPESAALTHRYARCPARPASIPASYIVK